MTQVTVALSFYYYIIQYSSKEFWKKTVYFECFKISLHSSQVNFQEVVI